MSDEVVQVDFASKVLLHQHWDGITCLPATKCSAQPFASRDQLEWSSSKFLPCCRNTDDATLSPASVRCLKR